MFHSCVKPPEGKTEVLLFYKFHYIPFLLDNPSILVDDPTRLKCTIHKLEKQKQTLIINYIIKYSLLLGWCISTENPQQHCFQFTILVVGVVSL